MLRAGDTDSAEQFQPKRRGAPALTGEAKAAALAKAKEDRRAWARARDAVNRKMEAEKERAARRVPKFVDIVINRTPHPEPVPDSALLAEIQRILGRSEPPVVDFEYTPAEPFTMPTRDPYTPNKWIQRTGFTQPHAKYIVRRVTKKERKTHEGNTGAWELYALRREPDTVWTRPGR